MFRRNDKIIKVKMAENTQGRDFVCGDLHGRYDILMARLGEVNFDKEKDRLFCTGDLIDRGPDSVKCITLLKEPWFFSTVGNHERMFLTYMGLNYSDYQTKNSFIRNGGEWVFDVKGEDDLLYYAHVFENMPVVIDVGGKDGFFITHAKLDNKVRRRDIDYYVWDRSLLDDIFYHMTRSVDYKTATRKLYRLDNFDNRKKIVYVGHNTIYNGHQFFINNHLTLDAFPCSGWDGIILMEHKETLTMLKERIKIPKIDKEFHYANHG